MKQANQPFHYSTEDGVEHFIEKGTVVGDKYPMLEGREVLFNELPNLDK